MNARSNAGQKIAGEVERAMAEQLAKQVRPGCLLGRDDQESPPDLDYGDIKPKPHSYVKDINGIVVLLTLSSTIVWCPSEPVNNVALFVTWALVILTLVACIGLGSRLGKAKKKPAGKDSTAYLKAMATLPDPAPKWMQAIKATCFIALIFAVVSQGHFFLGVLGLVEQLFSYGLRIERDKYFAKRARGESQRHGVA